MKWSLKSFTDRVHGTKIRIEIRLLASDNEDYVGEEGEVDPPVGSAGRQVLVFEARQERPGHKQVRGAGAEQDDEEHRRPHPEQKQYSS